MGKVGGSGWLDRTQEFAARPGRRIVATFKTTRQCKALAAELAGVWARSGGEAEDIRAGPLIERHEREAT